MVASNPLERRKNLLEEDQYQSSFDYSDIDSKDKDDLIEFEQQIRVSQTSYVKSTLDIGEKLFKAREKLKAYKTGTFMEWYDNLGFNKDSVSYFLQRYDLSLEYPQKRSYIADIPVRIVKELNRKDLDPKLKEKAIEEEVQNSGEFKSLKLKYEHGENYTQTKTIKTKVEFEEIRQLLKENLPKNVSPKAIDRTVDGLFATYKLTRR